MTASAFHQMLTWMAGDIEFARYIRANPAELTRSYGLTAAEAATVLVAKIDTAGARPGRLEPRLSRSDGVFGSALAGAVSTFESPDVHADGGHAGVISPPAVTWTVP